jgi:predicted PurR-regulated permease PerM
MASGEWGTSFQRNTLWLIALILLLWLLFQVQEVLFILFSAFILASAMAPLVDRLDTLLPRWISVLIPFAALLLIGLVVILPVGTSALYELQDLVKTVPAFLDVVRVWGEQLEGLSRQYPLLEHLTVNRLLEQISTYSGAFFSGFTGVTMAVSKVLLNLLTVLIISFFLLLDREKIQAYCLKFLPEKKKDGTDKLIHQLIRGTGAFVNGQLLFMASFAALITLGLYALNVPFALLFGLLSGALTLIPILGPNIAMVPTMAMAFIYSGDPWQVLWILLLFALVQLVENNVVGPLLMGKAVGLHPLAIIVAIIVGGLLFGMVGIVLAIPAATCINIILNQCVLNRESPASPTTESLA